MDLTRRQLPAVLAGPLAARAQTPAPESQADLVKAAAERVRRNAEAIRKFSVSMETEPAFSFKALDHA